MFAAFCPSSCLAATDPWSIRGPCSCTPRRTQRTRTRQSHLRIMPTVDDKSLVGGVSRAPGLRGQQCGRVSAAPTYVLSRCNTLVACCTLSIPAQYSRTNIRTQSHLEGVVFSGMHEQERNSGRDAPMMISSQANVPQHRRSLQVDLTSRGRRWCGRRC